jgi:hypothetical protein
VSKIFDWYGEDFGPRAAYFARQAALLSSIPEEIERVKTARAAVSFLEYDWALNDAR